MTRIKQFISNKIQDRDIEFFLFVLFFGFMAVYYMVRLFCKAPWYDELYTYNYFISNGPLYSAIHWPVPNNHIGYSVLSGILYVCTHSSFISLRGVSYIAALANLVLIFILCRKLMKKGFALTVTAVYAGMWLVNNLAVQGRGYTLAATMMLIAVNCMVNIILDENCGKSAYIWWTVALCMGFYVVTSSLYWVVSVCVSAGLVLLIYRRYRQLVKLILYSLGAAFATAFLYLMVWLAIGSNLLIKETAEYASFSHVSLILHHPFAAAARGIEYMLATPYIQSVSRDGYMAAFGDHYMTLLGQLYDWNGALLAVVIIGFVLAIVMVVSHASYMKKNKTEEDNTSVGLVTLSVMVPVMTLFTPLIVFAQCKLPYYRVFSFYGFTVAFTVGFVLYVLFGSLRSLWIQALPVVVVAFAIAQLLSVGYNNSYGSREDCAYEILTAEDLDEYDTVVVTDCDLEYMYKFIYDRECSTDIQDALNSESKSTALVVYDDILSPDAEYSWENYYDSESMKDFSEMLASGDTVHKVCGNGTYSLYGIDN